MQTSAWWLISGIDVIPSAPLNTVVTFGSSTTDGFGSTLNANRSWPDYLAHRLKDAGKTRFMSVLNAGIGGNQLTSSEMPLAAGMPPFLFGEAGSRRLDWDVLAQPAATDLIVHIGSNDLRVGVAGTTLIKAFRLRQPLLEWYGSRTVSVHSGGQCSAHLSRTTSTSL